LGSIHDDLDDDEEQLEDGWVEGVLCWVAADVVESCGEFEKSVLLSASRKGKADPIFPSQQPVNIAT